MASTWRVGRTGSARSRGPSKEYRLVTDLLDAQAYPASELAALYHQRWEIESVLGEIKTYHRGPKVVLASKTPDGVRQQIWAHLLVHHALRVLMCKTAAASRSRSALVHRHPACRPAQRHHFTGDLFPLTSWSPR
ncbi:transposase [Streptomyces sp. 7N604]|uniref:transposase n=1 Tax=Streptomyces sp. 7N604 TaxID=3457415 RepID=UPI003FD21799